MTEKFHVLYAEDVSSYTEFTIEIDHDDDPEEAARNAIARATERAENRAYLDLQSDELSYEDPTNRRIVHIQPDDHSDPIVTDIDLDPEPVTIHAALNHLAKARNMFAVLGCKNAARVIDCIVDGTRLAGLRHTILNLINEEA